MEDCHTRFLQEAVLEGTTPPDAGIIDGDLLIPLSFRLGSSIKWLRVEDFPSARVTQEHSEMLTLFLVTDVILGKNKISSYVEMENALNQRMS